MRGRLGHPDRGKGCSELPDTTSSGRKQYPMRQAYLFPSRPYTLLRRILLLTALSLACSTLSRGQLATTPIILEIKGYPGGMETGSLGVSNSGRNALRCSIAVFALDVGESGLPTAVANAPRSCKGWISLQPEAFSLKPGESAKVVLRLRPPKGTEGGYYAMLLCDGAPESPATEDEAGTRVRSGIHFSYRNMVPVLVTIQGGKLTVRILTGKPVFTEAGNQKGFLIKTPVFNAGTVHTRVTGSLEIGTETGQPLQTLSFSSGQGLVLPDHARLFPTRDPIDLPDGLYQAQLRLEIGSAKQPQAQKYSFTVDKGLPTLDPMTTNTLSRIAEQSAGFIIAPRNLSEEVVAGGRRSVSVELTNVSQLAIPVRASVVEWVRMTDGRDRVSSQTLNAARSARGAVGLQQPNSQIRPRGKQRVPILLSLPRGAAGDYYAALTFDRTDRQLDASPEELVRRSVFVLVKAKGTGAFAAAVEQFTATRQPSGAIALKVQVKNTGTLGFIPEASILIKNAKGENVGRLTLSEGAFMIQAGASGAFSMGWNQVLEAGKYTANLELRFSPNLPPVTARVEFQVSSSAQP